MIQVENLSFSYPNTKTSTLNDVSFTIQEGEIFGFLGPSGSGKSTTQKVLFKLLSDYSGSVLIKGKEIKDWDRSLYEYIGVGFELPNHYLKLTALENLTFFGGFYSSIQDPMYLLDLVGLKPDAHKKVGDYSKGMKMRLNFVRALLHNPELIFLDEPTSGLDPVNAHIIKDIIKNLKREGKTIFITTHNMHDADELCDRVAFIVDGHIRAIDSPYALKQKHGNRTVEIGLTSQSKPFVFPLDQLDRKSVV